MRENMGKLIKVKSGNEKALKVFNKIWYGQIMLDSLKKAVKIGRENIKKLREELAKLKEQGYYPVKSLNC